jgi:HK97 gp10 family phage protein
MAVIRSRRPIPRERGTLFGGSKATGSKFSGFVEVNTSGLEALLGKVSAAAAERVLRPVAEKIGEIAQSNAPVRTGELRDSKYVEIEHRGDRVVADVGFSANHAAPVEYGAGGFRGPVEPRPYLRPAFDEVVGSGEAEETIREGLRRELEG